MKFAKTHEWVEIKNAVVVVGITDYAQKELGDIVFVELPRVGDKVSKSSQFGTIESTKAASELYSPVSGEVIEVNNELAANPQWVNESPFDKGWMMKLKMKDKSELNELLSEEDYKDFLAKESH